MGNMVRTKARSAEEKRQLGDRSRALHQAAYRFIVASVQQSNQFPSTEQLAEWLKEMGKQPRVGRLLKGLVDHGWILPNGEGYKLRTQQSPESVLEALIYCYENKQRNLIPAIIANWREQQGRATAKAGRGRRVRGS